MRITKYTVSAAVPHSLRFLVLSDLHGCDNAPLLAAIRRESPDAVLLPGDCVHNAVSYAEGVEFLSEAARLCPVFCSIGNHEQKYGEGVDALLAATGAVVLDNSAARFGGITVGGLSSGFARGGQQGRLKETPPPDLAWLAEFDRTEGYKLLLCHHPEYFPRYIRQTGIDLTLAGHAHGGQWRIGNQGVFAPGQGIFPRYTGGLYEGRLLVSRGLGNPHCIPRIFNAPEIILLQLDNSEVSR